MPELDHLSYSTWNSYNSCPRSMYLNKVRGALSKGAYYFIIGSVVHECVEARLKGEPFNVRDIYYRLIREQMRTDPDEPNWLAGTYQDKSAARENGLQLAGDCVKEALRWLKEEFTEIVMFEADVSGFLPGCEVPVKGFVDIVAKHKDDGWVIGDWKSSASKPKDNFQLITYRALQLAQGVDRYKTGRWIMLRPGVSRAKPVDLSKVDPAEVGRTYQQTYEKIKQGIFPTQAGWACKYCTMQPNCMLQSGKNKRTEFYDDVSRRYIPF